MKEIPNPESLPTLEQVRDQFQVWRQSRKKRSPIPDAFWQAAIHLCQNHTISKVSGTLRLNYAVLKQRVQAYALTHHPEPSIAVPSFIELNMGSAKPVSECIVEMADQKGATMRMYFKGEAGLDLLELGKAFWNKRP